LLNPKDPAQRLQFQREPDTPQLEFAASPAFATLACGGWGSGKTTGGLGFLFLSAMLNPKGTTGMAIQPTHQLMNEWLETELLPSFRPLIRHQDIGRRVIHLPGGRRLLYRSGHKPERLQLSNLSYLYLDEPHLMSEKIFLNAIARARDSRAAHLRIGLTSLPKIGWLSRQFKSDEENPHHRVMHIATDQNKHLHPDYITNLRRACPARMERCYLGGQFVPGGGSVYGYEFGSGERHVIDWGFQPWVRMRGNQVVPDCGVSIDWASRRPHVLFWQRIPAGVKTPMGWTTEKEISICIDELYPPGEYRAITVRHLCNLILSKCPPGSDRPYPLRWAVVDPAGKAIEATSGTSEINQAQKFLGFPVLYQTGRRIKIGIQHVQLALEPIIGRPTLFFAKHLVDNVADPVERSVISSMAGYSYPESADGKAPDEPVHDDTFSHACDCVRYYVDYFHPVDRLSTEVWSAA
jgi:hypothetical protein